MHRKLLQFHDRAAHRAGLVAEPVRPPPPRSPRASSMRPDGANCAGTCCGQSDAIPCSIWCAYSRAVSTQPTLRWFTRTLVVSSGRWPRLRDKGLEARPSSQAVVRAGWPGRCSALIEPMFKTQPACGLETGETPPGSRSSGARTIHRHHAVEELRARRTAKIAPRHDRRAVHHRINPPKCRQSRRHDPRGTRRVGQIIEVQRGRGTQPASRPPRHPPRSMPCTSTRAPSSATAPLGNRPSDAGRAAGDDDDLVFQAHEEKNRKSRFSDAKESLQVLRFGPLAFGVSRVTRV